MADGDARELMRVLTTLPQPLPQALVAYLGLWRSQNRALAWPRALKIANETVALAPADVLTPALEQVVLIMRNKQAEGTWKPLSSHGYLKKVLADTPAIAPTTGLAERHEFGGSTQLPARPFVKPSATSAGIGALQGRKR